MVLLIDSNRRDGNEIFEDLRTDMKNVADVLIEISACSCLKVRYEDTNNDCPYSPYLYRVLPDLLKEMDVEQGTDVLQTVYHMCDTRNRHNRIPMLACTRLDVMNHVADRILRENCDGLDVALLLLNNLAIPSRNKIAMMSCSSAKKLLDGLFRVINRDVPEKLLGIICLVNITICRNNVDQILNHVVEQVCNGEEEKKNTTSLLGILDTLLVPKSSPEHNDIANTPLTLSIEKETIRWACKLAMNLCASEDNAVALSVSDVPKRLLNLLRNSTQDRKCWSVESIEDSALKALRTFASWPVLKSCLVEEDAITIVKAFTGQSDQKDYKSHEILTSLGDDSGLGYSECLNEEI